MKKKVTVKTVLIMAVTLILLAISLFPFYYMVVQSLQPWDMVDKTLAPTDLTLRSYEYLIGKGGATNSMMWIRALLNSLLVSLPTAVISVAIGLAMGYTLSKLGFRGEKFIMDSLLFQMFFPTIILLVPRYMIAKSLANTYAGMIIPMCISIWAIFMYINYFKTVPGAVFEAARIDGLTEYGIWWHIMLPLSLPALSTLTIFTFVNTWNDFLGPLIYLTRTELKTIQIGLRMFISQYSAEYGLIMAASVIALIPVLIVFLALQKYFVQGVASAGLKG